MTALGSIKHLYTIVEKYIYTDSWQAESQGKSWPWALRLQNYNHNIKSVNQNKIVNLYMKSTIKVHREKNIFFLALWLVSAQNAVHTILYTTSFQFFALHVFQQIITTSSGAWQAISLSLLVHQTSGCLARLITWDTNSSCLPKERKQLLKRWYLWITKYVGRIKKSVYSFLN